MEIGILSRNEQLYSTRRLIEACQKRDHAVQVVDTVRAAVQLSITPHSLRNTSLLPQLDAVIPRIGASVTQYGLRVVKHYESRESIVTATEQGIAQSRDKLYSHRAFQAAQLPVAKTIFVIHPKDLWPAIHAVGGLPVVLKRRQSTQGRGVMLLSSPRTVRTVCQIMERQRTPISLLVQAFIPEASGKDMRVIVVGGECVAAMERTAPDGEFRSNLHLGGSAVAATPSPQIQELARKATDVLQLPVAGIDIIHSDQGPLLLEANSSPGLEGIERSSGVDVAGKIVEFLEQEFQRRRASSTPQQQFPMKSALA